MGDESDKLDPGFASSEFVQKWAESGPCFGALLMFVSASIVADEVLIRKSAELIQAHSGTCGGCFGNVRKAIETLENRERKKAYRNCFERAQIAWVRMNGGDYQIFDEPDGRRILWKVPKAIELPYEVPYTSMEVFTPRRSEEAGWAIYDAASEEVFRKPGILLQFLDETATGEVQRYDAKMFPNLHWGSVASDERFELKIRWEGQVKTLARGHTLQERYGKRLKSSFWGENSPELGDTATDEILALRDLALKYKKDASWFAGFVDRTLENRRKDRWEKGSRDAYSHAVPVEPREKQLEGQEDNLWLDRQLLKKDPWKEELPAGVHELDRESRLQRILKELAPIEKHILQFKLEGLTDKQVGRRLNLTRETVNRKLAKIKKMAKEPPE